METIGGKTDDEGSKKETTMKNVRLYAFERNGNDIA